MNRSRTTAFLAVLLVAGVATGIVMYLQGGGSAEARDAGQGIVPAPVVPEAETVHEGTRSAIAIDHAEPIPMKVYASPTCGCCSNWMEHIGEHGFEIEVEYRQDMGAVKESLGLSAGLTSCHTAVVNDYVVEGHVPGEDLRRFLAESPEALGITVPGMPVGSPGMEMPSGEVDEYDVLTFSADGATEVFASHGPGSAG